MYKTVSTLGMDRSEWLRLRRTGIGGSDAGAICGLNPYVSAMSVYKSKVSDDVDDEDNESMRQGRDLEEYVAKRFCEATGLKVRRSNVMYRSREYSFMIADVDRLVVGEDAGLECKTASAFSADKWRDGQVPPHYLMQCYHYMAVTGKKVWYIAVAILGRDFKYARIEWDDKTVWSLVQIEKAFWERHVIPHVMPVPDGSKDCDDVLMDCFPGGKKAPIPLIGFDEKLKHREELVSQIESLEAEQKQIEQEIKLYMADNEAAYADGYRISWASVDSVRIDAKRLKAEKPEIYESFSNTTTARRLTIKAA